MARAQITSVIRRADHQEIVFAVLQKREVEGEEQEVQTGRDVVLVSLEATDEEITRAVKAKAEKVVTHLKVAEETINRLGATPIEIPE